VCRNPATFKGGRDLVGYKRAEDALKRECIMARKKAAIDARRGSELAARATLSHRATREALALELYGVIRAALKTYGLSPSEQKRIFGQSQRRSDIRHASVGLLGQIRPLGDLLTSWFEEVPYVDSVGAPRILKIEGHGATFESLAKRFLPGVPLTDVVALACRTANVGTLSGGRIALYGDTMVNLSKNIDGVLAQNILHVRQIFDTCLYNAQRDPDDDTPGRLERIVTHVLSTSEFEKFQGEVRGQLHDLCERFDRLLKSAADRSTRQKPPRGQAGIGIYIYYNGPTKRRANHRKGSK
jgi:hypothetical protein